ncbi:Protein fem-1-like B [Stylophora pistillata]|uniref:Protein fem-1 homolog B n=1 Tax=Stylophora pistillata TaxID=50429 RepID=A0A2B4R7U6_STYPI|nr:Protein fem-1-like B [Stylophora pistillata]
MKQTSRLVERLSLKERLQRVVKLCGSLLLKGHLDVVRLLIEQNADVDGRTSTNSTLLRAAAFIGWPHIVRCLVENGAAVNARTNFNSTPLMPACYYGHMEVVSFLIENGANVHLQDIDGNTCLHYAAKREHFQIVVKLLALGAKQKHNLKGLTPLLTSSNDCKTEMVKYFISRPECTKEQRIDALELLGATIANDPDAYDIEKAFSFMKRGMEERCQYSHRYLHGYLKPHAKDEVTGSGSSKGGEARFVPGREKDLNYNLEMEPTAKKKSEMDKQLTIVRGQLREKSEALSSLEERLRARDQEVIELETSLSTTQRTATKRSRQQTPDWVTSRDQTHLTEKCLGSGGWGNVVEGKYCGCIVAVKGIYEDLSKSSPYYRELFKREMNIASKCSRPCPLQFIGATNDKESPLFVTELLETSL